MGNDQSRTLSDRQQKFDKKGLLHKTIGEIWEVEGQDFDGAYANARLLRRGGNPKPEMYKRILRKATASPSAVAAAVFEHSDSLLSLLTEDTRAPPSADQEDEHVEPVSPSEMKVTPKAVVDGEAEVSRAHLLPKDEQSKIFWGKIVELLSGADDNISSVERDLIVRIVSELKSNRFVLGGPHNEIFDNLKRGIVIPIPLLSQSDIAGWQNRQPYEVLIICDSSKTYKAVEKDTEHPHVKWATEADLMLATEVLSTNTKILADSLCEHWDDYHSQRAPSQSARHKALNKLRNELGKSHRVSVPKVTRSSRKQAHLNPWNPFDSRLKLYKIDYSMLYEGEITAYIPDPWLLAIKAAVNWSTYSHKKKLKLLPACSDFDSSGSSSGYSDVSEAFKHNAYIQHLAMENIQKLRDEDINGKEVQYVSDDEADYSSVSSLSGDLAVAMGGNGDETEENDVHCISEESESMEHCRANGNARHYKGS